MARSGDKSRQVSPGAKQTSAKHWRVAKAFRDAFGNRFHVPATEVLPRVEVRDQFFREFATIADRKRANVRGRDRETFRQWWLGKSRPSGADVDIVVEILFGPQWPSNENAKALGKLCRESLSRDAPAGRVASGHAPASAAAVGYEARPLSYQEPPSLIVGLRVDIAPAEGDTLDPGNLPVFVRLNWGYDDEQDFRCRLYLCEFDLFANLINCAMAGDVLAEGTEPRSIGGINVLCLGRRWQFTVPNGAYLAGVFANNGAFFHVRHSENADGLPRVELTGRVSGQQSFHAVWTCDVADKDRLKHAVVEQLLKKHAAQEYAPVTLIQAGVQLTEKKP